MQLLSVGDLGRRPTTPARCTRNGDEWATIVVSSDRGGSRNCLCTSVGLTTIDGFQAFRVVNADGTVAFVWSVAPGRWAQLFVSVGLADRADEIAASLTRAPLPPFDPSSPDTTPTRSSSTLWDEHHVGRGTARHPMVRDHRPDVTLGDVKHRDPLRSINSD